MKETSPIAAIAAPITIEVLASVPHGNVWLEFFKDANGSVQTSPTAGTVAFVGRPEGDPGYTVPLSGSPMSAATPEIITWSGAIDRITVTPASVTGNTVAYYRVCWRQYKA